MTLVILILFITLCIFTELKPPHDISKLRLCVKELPKANYQTLKMLSDHLRRYDGIDSLSMYIAICIVWCMHSHIFMYWLIRVLDW